MKRLLIIGDPVEQSLSPTMHNAALMSLGLEKKFKYEKMRIGLRGLEGVVDSIKEGEIEGVNVTIPHKTRIIEFVDKLTPEARMIGAVNTIFRERGKVIGHNSDGLGCIMGLKEARERIEGQRAVILGAGGAARAISFALVKGGVKGIVLLNRTLERAKVLAKDVNKAAKGKVKVDRLARARSVLKKGDLLVNCTSVGMKGKHEKMTPVPKDSLHPSLMVMDTIYNPMRTRLLVEADTLGCRTLDGISMLVHQGAVGFKLWTGKKAPIEVMRKVVLENLKVPVNMERKKNNIALIGFMGTGKSVVARLLAKRLGKDFIDNDDLISKKARKSVKRIFLEDGEKHFRELEEDSIKMLSERSNIVIGCGGGAILNTINVARLRKGSILVLLKARPEIIAKRVKKDDKRPLLITKGKKGKVARIREILMVRDPYYRMAADVEVDTTDLPVDAVVDHIVNLLGRVKR